MSKAAAVDLDEFRWPHSRAGIEFQFLVWGGAGATYDLTARWVLNAGVRFSHISNADTDSPNRGLNYLLSFVGFSSKLF